MVDSASKWCGHATSVRDFFLWLCYLSEQDTSEFQLSWKGAPLFFPLLWVDDRISSAVAEEQTRAVVTGETVFQTKKPLLHYKVER